MTELRNGLVLEYQGGSDAYPHFKVGDTFKILENKQKKIYYLSGHNGTDTLVDREGYPLTVTPLTSKYFKFVADESIGAKKLQLVLDEKVSVRDLLENLEGNFEFSRKGKDPDWSIDRCFFYPISTILSNGSPSDNANFIAHTLSILLAKAIDFDTVDANLKYYFGNMLEKADSLN